MGAMIFRDSCMSEVSSECVNREEYLYAPIEYMHDHPPQDLIPICLVSANDLGVYIGLTDPAI